MNQAVVCSGKVVQAFGNLLQVEFDGNIRQGEVAMVNVGDTRLKAEVIEIAGKEAKIQVYEATNGIKLNTPVEFTGDLLEAELGPGLLTSIFDGLQNPLEKIALTSGYFLPKGLYLEPIDRQRHWEYKSTAKVGDVLVRGQAFGETKEGRFKHYIMIPFSMYGKYTLKWINKSGNYKVDTVVARVIDENGKEHELTMLQKWPIKIPLLVGEKIKAFSMMTTGCRIIDTQFPVMQGGTFCTPGPFGAGKTVIQHHLAKYSAVDVVIVIACGERAGEVVEILREFPHLIDPNTGETLINRTIIICNTSSMPVAARESSIYTGITLAEYYRQMGLNILVLADSTSRWAQALREMSGRLEEIPGEEAFPAYLSSRIAAFYERSGVVFQDDGRKGSITIGGAVSPAGGNFEEPVTQSTLSVVGAFLGLSRARSDARRYPAVDPLTSWSKYIDDASTDLEEVKPKWKEMVMQASKIMHEGDEIGKRMEVVGEEGTSIEDMITYLKAELYDSVYLQQNFFDKEDAYCPINRQALLFTLICKVFDSKFTFKAHDDAREFFLSMQNNIKNMNCLPFESSGYKKEWKAIESMIIQKQG